ncbi:MAG TPA: hypothetical protein VKB26_14145 [Candidatus Acidoferrales bacterium]|nr:hypothetical protein [Candidatus Acidoferrales bacterium]
MGVGQERTQRVRKKSGVIATLLVILAGLAAVDGMIPSARGNQRSRAATFPADFEANESPNSPVKYSARTAFYSLFISNEEADVVLHGEKMPSNELTRGQLIVVKAYASLVRMRFVGSNPPTGITPLNSSDSSHPPYTAVAYRGIYPGTDVLLRAQQRKIAFQLNLSSGADPENIVLELSGITGIKLDKAGNAIISVGHASFMLQNPAVRIQATANRQLTSGAYRVERGNRLRFIVPAANSANSETMGD